MAEAAALLRFSSAHAASDANKAAFSADVRSAVRTSMESSQGGSRQGSLRLPDAEGGPQVRPQMIAAWALPASWLWCCTWIHLSTVH